MQAKSAAWQPHACREPREGALPTPIRFTSCEKKADAFGNKGRQLLSKGFRVMPHQGSHEHWEQNEIHKDLSRGGTSFRTEGSLWRVRKHVGGVVKDLRDGICSPIPRGVMELAAQLRESVCFSNDRTSYTDQILDGFFGNLGAETYELVLQRTSLGFVAIEIGQAVHDPSHNCGEERLLPRKVSINRRFACGSELRDLVDTRALEPSLEENPVGRIEDALLDVAGKVLGRSAETVRRSLWASILGQDPSHVCNHDTASAPPREQIGLDTLRKKVQIK